MAYEEYLDLIERASLNGKYILYALDGVNASRNKNPELFILKTKELLKELTRLILCTEKKDSIMVRDDIIYLNDKLNYFGKPFRCYNNPNFSNGDLVSLYFYSDQMDIETFEIIFNQACKNTNNNFEYHLSVQKYETNDYLEGNTLLWVGYAQQYLNDNKNKRIKVLNSNKINNR